LESIKSKMLDNGLGYVRLSEFTQRSALDFDAALKNLRSQGMRVLIVDLRNNPADS